MMRPGHRGARQQQDQRVEKRELERIERVNPLRRPDAADRKQARREERPEECREEHHLGGDEQRHAVAQTELHDRGVEALEGRLADHVAPPDRHGAEDADQSDDQQGPAMAVHVQNAAGGEQAGGDRPDDRPRARIDQVIGVLGPAMRVRVGVGIGVAVGHLSPPGSLNLPQRPSVAGRPPHSDGRADAPGTSCRTG